MPAPEMFHRHRPWILFLALASVFVAALASIPGYFSADELQWLARARSAPTLAALPWVSFTDLSPFQYRPLTFNLWLLLAHLGGDRPWFSHAAFALAMVGIALLLRQLLLAFGVQSSRPWNAATLFLLLPTTVFSAGWVGTLADLLVAAIALAAMLLASHARARPMALAVHATIALLSTAVALLAKESALVLPLAWLLYAAVSDARREGIVAAAAASVAVATYLLLRMDPLLHPPSPVPYYAWQLSYLPRRVLDYLLFPLLPSVEEAHTVALRSVATQLGAGLLVLLWWRDCWQRARWRGLAVTAASLALIGPALLLPKASAHFALLAGVALAAGLAWLAPAPGRNTRWLHALLLLLLCWHDVNLLRRFHRDAAVQTALLDDAARILATPAGTHSLRLHAGSAEVAHVLARSASVPSWRGQPLQLHVVDGEPARSVDFVVQSDGRLRPATER
ncbi:MAG: hypothetical protein IPG63_06160 [Xanthomonadales bacterium]|nr:hypothetical protein [Xanthomonadales bacterium]